MTAYRAASTPAPPGTRAGDPTPVAVELPPGRARMAATGALSVGAALATVAAVTLLWMRSGPGDPVPPGVQVAVAAVGIVAGIPHGAVDHVVAVRLAPGPPRGAVVTMATVLACYVAVAGLAATALLVAPTVSTAVFLLVAAAHFAWGEVTFAAGRRGRPLAHRDSVVAATVLGLVLVGLPLSSEQGRAALAVLAPGLVDALDRVLDALPGGPVTLPPAGVTVPVVVLLVVVAAVVMLAVGAWRGGRRREAAEVGVLLALFLAAPPLVAFGVYFGAWHALRHTRRLVDLLAPGGARRAQARAFVRAAALPTLGALGVLAALWTMRSHSDVVATGVSLLLALTFPHVVVVAALDRRRAGHP